MDGNQGRRPRRSSFTQHVQRLLNYEKQANKRNSLQTHQNAETPQKESAGAENGDSVFVHYFTTSTEPSSYSPMSRDTPTNRTDSSRSSLRTSKEPDTEQTQPDHKPDRSEICVSPVWQNTIAEKKEKRVTRRLEAERKELERRLKNLEKAEMTRDLSSFKREPRRLTKKQPMGSSSRDSSRDADRRRSSNSTLNSFFSGVRRASRSRSRSRQQSTDAEQDDEGPSRLLALPERFGAAISKGLAQKRDMSLTDYTTSQRTLHTTLKSADLRESVRNSQALSENVEPNTINYSKPISNQPKPKGARQTNGPKSSDLDRTSFTATLNSGKRDSGAQTGSPNTPTTRDTPSGNTSDARHAKPSTSTPSDQTRRNAEFSPNSISTKMPTGSRNPSPIDSVHQQKRFISSPLATAPVNGGDLPRAKPKQDAKPIQTLPSKIPRSDDKERSLSILDGQKPGTGTALVDGTWLPVNVSSKQMNRQSMPPIPPRSEQRNAQVKVTTEKSRRTWYAPTGASTLQEQPEKTGINSTATVTDKRRNSSPDTSSKNKSLPTERMSRRETFDEQKRLSSPSRDSSQEPPSEDYNTADEAVSSADEDNFTAHTSKGKNKNKLTTCIDLDQTALSPANAAIPKPLNPRFKQPEDRKIPLQGQVVGKVFVICCRCKYWHDMPSEVYAKLACPDLSFNPQDLKMTGAAGATNQLRKDNEGTKSRRNSISKRLASLPIAQSLNRRSMPPTSTTQPMASAKAVLQCCWCGHNMSRLCCQGWTTVVHMRERHH